MITKKYLHSLFTAEVEKLQKEREEAKKKYLDEVLQYITKQVFQRAKEGSKVFNFRYRDIVRKKDGPTVKEVLEELKKVYVDLDISASHENTEAECEISLLW